MSKTPTAESSQFKPRETLSPNNDQPNVSKTVYSHISNLHGLLGDWSRLRDKGTRFIRTVTSLKLHECKDDYYPSQLKSLMENLVEILVSLKDIVEGTKLIQTQLLALAKLQPSDGSVFSSFSARNISENLEKIYNLMEKEYKLKQVVIENIAHCRDQSLIEVYASSWEMDPYLSSESNVNMLMQKLNDKYYISVLK